MSGDKKLWKVTDGASEGGVIVYDPKDKALELSERLGVGSVVRQEEAFEDCIRYNKVRGKGPSKGWVRVRTVAGDRLLIPVNASMQPITEAQVADVPLVPPRAKVTAEPPELVYFDAWSRGELTRLAFHAGGVCFVDTRIPGEQWPAMRQDPESIPSQAFGAMPVIKHEGRLIAQSFACAQYAADLGMNVVRPKTDMQRGVDTMVLGVYAEIHLLLYPCVMGPSPGAEAFAIKALPAKLGPLLAGLERQFRGSGPFLYCSEADGPSLGDLAIFDQLTSKWPNLRALNVIDFRQYPKLEACVAACKAAPVLQAYLIAREAMNTGGPSK
eukprot:gnl/TRDRNA2_/TRDRNA2_161088_c0_seq1.p1 gnl/TRDRNA2_/TRDRNA2_161088_c0~~gnl/TRDRNA2_/TRDRNA2_161088_c0_seq1.p1  ORF type:complete len:327 (+),score=44.58 gnl/TRDRNA2_/TRDRNA2_161088_c0_seq1:190-1170(+)